MALEKTLVANLLHINGLVEFKPYREWLQSQRERWRDATESATDVALYRAQGRAQMLKEILDLLAQAPTLADKYRGQPHF